MAVQTLCDPVKEFIGRVDEELPDCPFKRDLMTMLKSVVMELLDLDSNIIRLRDVNAKLVRMSGIHHTSLTKSQVEFMNEQVMFDGDGKQIGSLPEIKKPETWRDRAPLL